MSDDVYIKIIIWSLGVIVMLLGSVIGVMWAKLSKVETNKVDRDWCIEHHRMDCENRKMIQETRDIVVSVDARLKSIESRMNAGLHEGGY